MSVEMASVKCHNNARICYANGMRLQISTMTN